MRRRMHTEAYWVQTLAAGRPTPLLYGGNISLPEFAWATALVRPDRTPLAPADHCPRLLARGTRNGALELWRIGLQLHCTRSRAQGLQTPWRGTAALLLLPAVYDLGFRV